MHVSSCIGVDHKVLWKSYVCKDRLYNVWKPRSCSIRSSRKSHFFRESFAYWSPWLKFKGWRLGIGTWCWLFYRTATEGPYEKHARLSALQWSPARFFWRVAQLPTISASHCRCFLILMSLPLSMRLTPLVHGFSPLVLSDTFGYISSDCNNLTTTTAYFVGW